MCAGVGRVMFSLLVPRAHLGFPGMCVLSKKAIVKLPSGARAQEWGIAVWSLCLISVLWWKLLLLPVSTSALKVEGVIWQILFACEIC